MTLDDLTQQLVGRPTLQQFCAEALRTNYQPTFQGGGDIAAKHRLADAFDKRMEDLGSEIRAHRCDCGCFPRPEEHKTVEGLDALSRRLTPHGFEELVEMAAIAHVPWLRARDHERDDATRLVEAVNCELRAKGLAPRMEVR